MPVPIVTIAQMREWEQATWASGQTPENVIRRVGELVARRALSLTRPGDRILILAGQGHNGDDARQAQPPLVDRNVERIDVDDPAGQVERVVAALSRRPALIVDGLFGLGLNRPLSADWTALINRVNASRATVLSVDVPSGLDADTGAALGAVVRADVTFTLGAPKRGLMQPHAQSAVGRLEVAPEIGLLPCPFGGDVLWTVPADFDGLPPRRPDGGHKGVFGHLAILGGSPGFHGAAVLAARAAQRTQPGLVSLFTLPATYVPVASQLQSVMVHAWRPGARWPGNVSAAVFGPGLAAPDLPSEVRTEVVHWWLEAPVPVVVDASALDWLPARPVGSQALRVITPHPGEAARMLASSVDAVEGDRVRAVRELSERFGDCQVVLKGRQTLVGSESGPVFVNPSGNPHLAQGGAGDVLAGFLGGLLAQPAWLGRGVDTLRYAAWQHGATADALTARRANWTVEELVEAMGDLAPC